MFVRQIYDPHLAQYAYLVGSPATGEALVIDPERDVDRYVELAERHDLRLTAAADTHIHADYLTGLRELAERGLRVYASDEGGRHWRYDWLVNSDYDHRLLHHGDTFSIGDAWFEAVHTPGHTPEHLSFLITDTGAEATTPIAIATGDFVFVGDLGRPDLLETTDDQHGQMREDANILFESVQRFKELPAFLQVWPAHGTGSACGKALGDVPQSTVGYELRHNASIQAAHDEDAFVDFILEGQPEPPLYFTRMKHENRDGPAVLGRLPHPKRLDADALGDLAGRTDIAVLDTRPDRSAFMMHHLPASLYAPLNGSFATIAGSYVEAGTPVFLIVDEQRVDEAVRALVRIGLDVVVGYAPLPVFEHYRDRGGRISAIDEIDFDDVERAADRGGVHVLDVRRRTEYESGHVPGAQHVAHTRLRAHLDDIPKDTTVLVHCLRGLRSAVAAALLARAGHEVRYVNDYIEHFPDLTREDEPAPVRSD